MTMTPQHVPLWLIGIDGGGTGTRARLARADGQPIALGEAGPSSLSQGIAQAWLHIQLAVQRTFENAGLTYPGAAQCALGLGLAGAHARSQAQAFKRQDPGFAHLSLDTDAGTTLRGAHGGQPGAIIAAGTGSVGEACFADGRRMLVGGWGFGVADEGSGAWMGLRALQQAQRAADGRAPEGALARAVWRVTGGQREAMLGWAAQAGQHGFARLAPLVFDAADADAAARRLLDDAAAELALIARALDPEAELPVCVMGSIGVRLFDRLPLALRQRCVAPAGDSAVGALQMLMADLARQPSPKAANA